MDSLSGGCQSLRIVATLVISRGVNMADKEPDLVVLTAEVAAAYFENNTIEPDKIGTVIGAIHAALKAIGDPAEEAPVEEVPKPSAAQIRK